MKSKVVDAKKLSFSYDDKPPKIFLKGVGDHDSSVDVDPWPCYAHPKELVADTLEWVVSKSWDLGVKIFIGHYECVGRSNAFATYGHEYGKYDEDAERWPITKKPFIFLNGKRIPPHPGVTRYLVGHEYGHCVDHWISDKLYGDKEINGLREDYRKLRGVSNPGHYGSGTWHKSPGEVFACDFRILVCGLEKDFWPHEGIDYPDPDSEYAQWWSYLLSSKEEDWEKPGK